MTSGVDCSKLIAVSMGFANTKYIKIAGGIEGTLDNLTIDEDYLVDTEGMPMDMVLNLEDDEVDVAVGAERGDENGD